MGKRKLQALRRLAAHEQGGRCAYCGQPMGPAEDCRRTSETADHVVPRAAGGRTTASNIVACCRACNQAKGCEQVQVRTDTRSRCDELGPQRGLGEEPW